MSAPSVPAPPSDLTVVVTGAAGPLGRRVCAQLASAGVTGRVRALDRLPVPAGDRPVDLLTDDLGPLLEGASVVVHLASVFGPALDDDPEVLAAADVTMARRVLAAAADASVPHVVVLSSATVYGAWANNPVPLTEDAPLRPHPGFAYAVQRAEIERLVAEWRDAHPGRTATVLRPAPTVADDNPGWLARSLRAAGAVRGPDDDPPAQFLHLDDLVAAVLLACEQQPDGVLNVAPDGWLTPTEFRELAGGSARLRAPRWLADRMGAVRRALRLAPPAPAATAYAHGPWVVANDRLRALGWEPDNSSAEAYVAAVPAGPWATISPRRRQELALAGTGVAAVGVVAVIIALVVRSRRRRR